jgi:opacity protein-like surface antigen
MNKLIKKSAATLLLASVAMPAFADNYNVGVSGAWAYLDADGQETKQNNAGTAFSKSATEQANFGFASIFAEYSKTYSPTTELVFGLDYVPFKGEIDARSKSDSDLLVGNTTSTAGTNSIKVELKNHATLYVQPTYKINNDSSWFFKLGYAQADVQASGASVSSTINKKDTMSGPVVGLGVQQNISKDFFVRLEANYTDYDTVSYTNTGGATVSADPTMYSAKISLAKRF